MISTRLKVKELLRERRWTTKVLAEKTGMSESYLTHIKNGTRRWNEDALKKLSGAFELKPTDLFANFASENALPIDVQIPEEVKNQISTLNLKVKIVPVVSEIPAQPSAFNNQIVQVKNGYSDQFVTVIGVDDDSMFCLAVDDSSMAPNFVKGDLLIVSPASWTSSGDLVAVEFGNENPTRAIMQINFSDNITMLESINHKRAPVALVKGKDSLRILGKVILRYQKMG
jgi:SOS-response transcriptional repressor LexA